MPHVISGLENRVLVPVTPFGSVRLHITDRTEIADNSALAVLDMFDFRFPKLFGEGELKVVVQALLRDAKKRIAIDCSQQLIHNVAI